MFLDQSDEPEARVGSKWTPREKSRKPESDSDRGLGLNHPSRFRLGVGILQVFEVAIESCNYY